MFKNEQGITRILYSGNVCCFCPMGDDWYHADVSVEIDKPQEIPDYCDIDAYLRELDGQHLILEDVCLAVFRLIDRQTNAEHIAVNVFTDSAVHNPVSVEIQK